MLSGFVVIRRNFGHWDICGKGERWFRIRGGPSKYSVFDERTDDNRTSKTFKTVPACMAYICDELMYELIVAEGQKPSMIASWNVPEQSKGDQG